MRAVVSDELNERIAQDPRLSKAQLDAIRRAGLANSRTTVKGLDAKMRPVLRTPGQSMYSLLRNGAPTRRRLPMSEEW